MNFHWEQICKNKVSPRHCNLFIFYTNVKLKKSKHFQVFHNFYNKFRKKFQKFELKKKEEVINRFEISQVKCA